MKSAYPVLIAAAMAATVQAQELSEKGTVPDAVRKAIDEFNRMKAGKSVENEVIVVLDPPATAGAEQHAKPEKPEAAPEDSGAVLVTGKPPAETESDALTGEAKETPPEIAAETPPETQEPPPLPEPEPEVRVESIRKGSGSIDPSQVKLKANFPAKALSTAPEGWALEKSEQAPVFRKDVELQPGTTISLSIKPHILAPASDGLNTFSVSEPGFEAPLGYHQENTVSAILGASVAELDKDSLQLGNAISELHRLLASLPKTEEPEKP